MLLCRPVTPLLHGLELAARRQAGMTGGQLQLEHSRDTKNIFLCSSPSLSSQQPKLNCIIPCQRPGRRVPQTALAHTALCSAQFWGIYSQRSRSGNGGRLNNTLLVREGRAVVSARCTRQLFSTSASSALAISNKTFCFTSLFFWEWHDTKQSPVVLQGHKKKKRGRGGGGEGTTCLFLHLTIAKH